MRFLEIILPIYQRFFRLYLLFTAFLSEKNSQIIASISDLVVYSFGWTSEVGRLKNNALLYKILFYFFNLSRDGINQHNKPY
jgi:hypothetical protein